MDDAQVSELASVFVRTLSAQNAVSMMDTGHGSHVLHRVQKLADVPRMVLHCTVQRTDVPLRQASYTGEYQAMMSKPAARLCAASISTDVSQVAAVRLTD